MGKYVLGGYKILLIPEKEVNSMKFTIIGRKTQVPDKVKDYAEKKLSKLEKFFREESDARVVFGTIKDDDYIEVSIFSGGMIYRAEVTEVDFMTATDKAVDIIERQIRKNKTRLEKKIKKDALSDKMMINGYDFNESEDKAEFDIVKTKRFIVKPMSVEEAILQMNLLGHNFFIFKNTQTNEMNIVYRRHDKRYAVIESIE